MAKLKKIRQFIGGGVQLVQTDTFTGSQVKNLNFKVPAGFSGTLATRTSGTQATFTLPANHTIKTGDRVDIYNTTGGSVLRHGVVGTVVGATVPITTGTGTIPDTVGATFVLGKQVSAKCVIPDTSLIKLFGLGVKCIGDYRSNVSQPNPAIHFVDAAGTGIVALSSGWLNTTQGRLLVNVQDGDENLLDNITNIDHILCSCPVSAQGMSLQFKCLYDLGS